MGSRFWMLFFGTILLTLVLGGGLLIGLFLGLACAEFDRHVIRPRQQAKVDKRDNDQKWLR